MPRTLPAWSAAVLCGGGSRRMGRDKALLEVNGEPMVQRVAGAMQTAGAVEVVAMGGDETALHALGLSVVPDRWPGEGPLGGLVMSLETCSSDIVFVAACDLLAPSPDAIRATVAALAANAGADIAVPSPSTRPTERRGRDEPSQWMHCAWRRRTLAPLLARFLAGERAVNRAVRDTSLAVVTVPGVDPAALADADTPGDLRRASAASRGRASR